MQQGRPTQIFEVSKEVKILQLKNQIAILEQQLDNAKRDLARLTKEHK